MNPLTVETFNLIDVGSQDDAVIIVRTLPGLIALALSLKHDGDLEIVLNVADCKQLLKMLTSAVETAQNKSQTE